MTYSFCEYSVSDLYKEIYNFRPGESFFKRWESSTDAQKQAIWDGLVEDLKRTQAQEEEYQRECIAAFEKRVSEVAAVMPSLDRKGVLRVLCDSVNCAGDINRAEFSFGLPYGYIKGVKPGMLV